MWNGMSHNGSWLNSHLAAPFGWPRSTLVMEPSIVPCKAKAKAEVVVRVPQAQTRRHLQLATESAENAIDEESPQTRIFLNPAARVPTGLEGAGVRGRYSSGGAADGGLGLTHISQLCQTTSLRMCRQLFPSPAVVTRIQLFDPLLVLTRPPLMYSHMALL